MNNNNFGIGLAVGISLGVITGILLAPQSGKETRELISTKVKEAKGKVEKTVKDI